MKRHNNGHRWTEKELRLLISMHIEGKEYPEIAKHFGVTVGGLHKQLCRLREEGINLPRRRNGHKGGRTNKPWTQEEIEWVIRRRQESATAEQIANELKRSFFGVQGIIHTLRKKGIKVKMLGQGMRRLWSVDSVNAAIAGRGLMEE